MKSILISIGTRPNMIKVTQFKRVAEEGGKVKVVIVHTGQHYDHAMAEVFFQQFNLVPDYKLELKAADPLGQMAEMMLKLGDLIKEIKPMMVLTPGDVNSTFAAAFTSYKLGVPVGHIESGLRSFDRSMPEEINRILTDQITDQYFVTEQSGIDNLRREGAKENKVHFVGNTMIDTLVAFESQIDASDVLSEYGIDEGEFLLLTFHRPANVDLPDAQRELMQIIKALTAFKKCVFPVHPRTQKAMESSGVWNELRTISSLIMTPPLGYFQFQKLVKHAFAVVTDSGGIQEETTFRRVPCITLRPNTERPITIEVGSNVLLPFAANEVMNRLKLIEAGSIGESQVPPLWDGRSTERILKIIAGL